jgi:electron transport complex protein RnfB
MNDDVFRRLARRLDAIPNGFPATESGVELRLLAHIFTAEQATLAAVMQLEPETAATIGARAGVEKRQAHRTLKSMARLGLVHVTRAKGRLLFGLVPFVVGFYEAQLPRMDAELAQLFEAYLQESRGATIYGPTPLHRVIPVGEAIPAGAEVFTHDHATRLISEAKAWSVRDCICRVQKRLIGEGCDHPVENCLVFAPVAGVFDHAPVGRAITREEALDILDQAAAAGLVHTTGNYRDGHTYICNCCTCSCGILRGMAEFGVLSAVARAPFEAQVAEDLCAACGDCVARCQFQALSLGDGGAVVDRLRCVGCGQCVSVCATGALQMRRRPAHEVAPLPADEAAWLAQRAHTRGITWPEVPPDLAGEGSGLA